MKQTSRIKIIYILGTSFSGSTLVGYLIGASRQVFNAGELMLFSKKKNIGNIPCFCGETTGNCDIWGGMALEKAILYSKPDLTTKIKLLGRLLFGLPPCPLFDLEKWEDEDFCRQLLENVQNDEGGSPLILDTSKSLFRLMFLVCADAFDIKIVYIKRDLLGNISSFVKNGDSVFRGLVNYKLNHFFMPLYLRGTGLDHYSLSYKALCRSPHRELAALGRFLRLNLAYDEVKEKIRTRTFHVFTGSNTRTQFKDFKGIRYDKSWRERLSRLQILCLQCIATKSEK